MPSGVKVHGASHPYHHLPKVYLPSPTLEVPVSRNVVEVNPYYDPQKLGLKIVGEIDCGGGYEFDKFVVWEKADGSKWYATDSGCSCPSPFENTELADLQPFRVEELRSWAESRRPDVSAVDVEDLIRLSV